MLREGAIETIDEADLRPDDLPTRHAAAVRATLRTSWEALTDRSARLALRAAGQLPQAEFIPTARLALLTGLAAEAQTGHPSPLSSALSLLYTASLIEALDGDQLRVHPLIQKFARKLSRSRFRLEMALRLASTFSDLDRLQKHIVRRGVYEVLEDLRTGLSLSESDKTSNQLLEQLAEYELVLSKESHNLADWDPDQQPSFLLQQLRNQCFVLNLTDLQVQIEVDLEKKRLPYLRERLIVNHAFDSAQSSQGHTGEVNDVALRADGKIAVSASADKTLKVWNLATGNVICTLEGHTDSVDSVAITPDGLCVISASWDRTLKVWELDTGKIIRTLEGHTAQVCTVAVTANGHFAVSGSYDGTSRVWELKTGEIVHTLKGNAEDVYGVAITPDDRCILSAHDNHTIKVWEMASGKLLRTLTGHTESVDNVVVTPDGRHIISTSDDQTVRVWDFASGQLIHTLEGHTDWTRGIAVTPDCRIVVSTSDDDTLKVWDLESGQLIRTLEGHTDDVYSVAITSDGQAAISASWDGTLKVWNLNSGQVVRTLEGRAATVYSVTISPDGQSILSAGDDRTLKVWAMADGQPIRTLKGHTGIIYGATITPNGRFAVSASGDGTIRIWNLISGELVRTLEGHNRAVNCVAVTHDGQFAISGADGGTIVIWDLNSGEVIDMLKTTTDGISSIALTPSGQFAVSTSYDRTFIVWDLTRRRMVYKFSEEWFAPGVAVTSDGRFAICSSTECLRVWDLESGETVRWLKGHKVPVHCIVVTDDTQLVISACRDKKLIVWDFNTGQPLLTLAATVGLRCCAISQDRRTIIAGDHAGMLHFVEWMKYETG